MAEGDYEITIWRRVAGTYLTLTNAAGFANRVISRNWRWMENFPKEFTFKLDNPYTDATKNMLSSSFAGWSSGTGAIAMGDLVHYKLKTNASPGTFKNLIWGKIVKLEPVGNTLTIQVKCFATTLENHNEDFVYFKNYRDLKAFDTASVNGIMKITGVSDANIKVPFAKVEFAGTDIRQDLGSGSGGNTRIIWDDSEELYYDLAQAVIPDGNGLLNVACHLRVEAAGHVHGALKCAIYLPSMYTPAIDEGDAFGDNALAVKSHNINYTYVGAATEDIDFSFIDSYAPMPLQPGQTYWVVFHWVEESTTDIDISMIDEDYKVGDNVCNYYSRLAETSTWSLVSGRIMSLNFDQADFAQVDSKDYVFVEATSEILLYGVGDSIVEIPGTAYDFCRGRLSYYYGTRALYEAAEYLIEYANDQLTGEASLSASLTVKTFATRGKKRGDCLREVANQTETAGDFSGRQHAFGHYNSNWSTPMSGTNKLKFNFRYKTSDDSYATFSHALDAATDQEARIISHTLKNTVNERPCLIRIIGKGVGGHIPPVITMHDLATTDSLGIALKGFAPVQSGLDENLSTLADVNAKVESDMNAVKRNTWAGSITLAGVFPELMQLDDTGDYYGSGRIITLNYSPLGISATKFKVTGVEVSGFTTTVFLTNTDILLKNWQLDTVKKANMTEGFYAPVGLPDVFYLMLYDDLSGLTAEEKAALEAAGPVYMRLCTSDGTPINCMTPVACPKFSSTDLSLNIFHGEFEAANGFTVDGTPVTRIELYDGAGNELTEYVIANASMSFPKWRSLAVVIDYTTKVS